MTSHFESNQPTSARRLSRRRWLAAIAWMLPLGTLQAAESVAITGGTVVNANGDRWEGTTVLLSDGVIQDVGAEVEIPYDATVIDAEGKTLFPGMVLAHTSQGLDRANENNSVTPFVNVYDALDPSSLSFEDALRAGVTTMHVIPGNNCVISGMSRIVQPHGMTVEAMTVRPEGGLKISISPKNGFNRMTQMAELRKALHELEQHVRETAERLYEEEREKQDKKVLVPPEDAIEKGMELVEVNDLDQRWQTLFRWKNGELPVYLHCDRASDLLRGIDWVKSLDLLERTTFVVGGETHKVAAALKATGRPVVLPGNLIYRETDPLTGEESETFVPKVFADLGISFALQTYGGSMGEGFLWYQAARLVREGIDRSVALQSITQWPADTLGLGQHLGSLERGKDGNILILSGDPLDQSTVVEKVLLGGVVAYERENDRRLKELLTGDEIPDEGSAADGEEGTGS